MVSKNKILTKSKNVLDVVAHLEPCEKGMGKCDICERIDDQMQDIH